MSLSAGTVAVGDDESVTGSGYALTLFNSIASEEQSEYPLPDPAIPDADFDGNVAQWAKLVGPVRLRIMRGWAREARRHAAIIGYLTAHGQVSITIPASTGGDGLQTGSDPGTPTTHPASPKTLTGTIA